MNIFLDNGTIAIAQALVAEWEYFQSLLSKDDPTRGSRGWHVPLIYSSVQSIRLRICLAAVVNAIEALRLCNGIMRG